MEINYPAGTIEVKGRVRPASAMVLVPPTALYEQSISSGAKLLYAVLLDYSRAGEVSPTQQELAHRLGRTDRTIRSHLKELQDAELLDVTQSHPP